MFSSSFPACMSLGPWAQLCLIRSKNLAVTPLNKGAEGKEGKERGKEKPNQLNSDITWDNLSLESFI